MSKQDPKSFTNKEVALALNNAIIFVSRWDEGVSEKRARSLSALTRGLYETLRETQVDDDGKLLFNDVEFTFCLVSAALLSFAQRLPDSSPLRNIFTLKLIS